MYSKQDTLVATDRKVVFKALGRHHHSNYFPVLYREKERKRDREIVRDTENQTGSETETEVKTQRQREFSWLKL